MNLDTLGNYVRWKYPSCASELGADSKVAYDRFLKGTSSAGKGTTEVDQDSDAVTPK